MKTFKRLILSLMALVILFAGSQNAFAYVDEDKAQKQEESEAPQDEEDPAEQKKDNAKQEDSKRESEPEKETGVLTPEGELDLQDDLAGEEAGDLQFMTVQTKDGTVFYLIIDHSSNSRNVYFLNQVDASDLLAIMNDEEVDAYEESLMEKEESKSKVIQPEQEEVREPAQEKEEKNYESKDEKKEKKDSALPLAAVLGVIAAGVLGGYYFFKIRPERNGSKIDRMEFEDDEYIDDGSEEPDE